jgi:hypothetical protein
MQQPRLLVLERLLEPSCHALQELAEMRVKLGSVASDSLELRGVFLLMVACLEIMLTDTYLYYLRSFPEAFEFSRDVQFGKEDILSANLAVDLIEQQVQKNTISQSYGNLPDLLRTFTRALNIAEPPLDSSLIDRLVEIKETRNLLLHNKLRVNRRYAAKSGPFRRQSDGEGHLALPHDYVIDACKSIETLIRDLQERLKAKYSSFTRLAALRRLWEFLFSSPVMPFDDFWVTDADKDEVVAIKEGRYEKRISSSERIFLAVWRAHFNGWKDPSGHVDMYKLDARNRQKMLWFLATLVEFNVR